MQQKFKFLLSSVLAVLVVTLAVIRPVAASSTSNFTQTINAGVLAIDIVDAAYATVASPGVAFPAITFGFACQTNVGTLGTTTQQIYVTNPDVADNGWTASIAGSAATAVWDGAATDYDFNDPTGTGCTDGADADAVGGQMTVNPAVGTLANGNCTGCNLTGVTLGTSTAFSQAVTDSITVINAAAGSSDVGDWTLQGVTVSQKIPAQQAAAADYDINMVLSVVAN